MHQSRSQIAMIQIHPRCEIPEGALGDEMMQGNAKEEKEEDGRELRHYKAAAVSV